MVDERRHGSGRISALGALWVLITMAIWVIGGGGASNGDAHGAVDQSEGEMVFALPGESRSYLKVSFVLAGAGADGVEQARASLRSAVHTAMPGARELPASGPILNYVRNGYWLPSRGAEWTYNPDGKPAGLAGESRAVHAAAATWNTAGADFRFGEGSESRDNTGACAEGGDGRNTVGWGALDGRLLAVTCSLFRNDGGELNIETEFDIRIDPEWAWTADGPVDMDLQSVVLHEFGHALGLGHAPDSATVMFADYPPGIEKRTLTQDDLDGLFGLYGARPAPPPPAPMIATSLVALSQGNNLIAWPGRTAMPWDALSGDASAIRAVYGYDPARGGWLRYFPGLPSYLNTLPAMQHGEGYWFVAGGDATLKVAN